MSQAEAVPTPPRCVLVVGANGFLDVKQVRRIGDAACFMVTGNRGSTTA